MIGRSVVESSRKAACEEFVEKLMSATPIEGGLVGPPPERGAEIINSVGLPG
jgi:hypothetical protein